MAKTRPIIKRRKAVRNIHKITRTMQLIATARFQAAFALATRTRPYTERITELVEALSGEAEGLDHSLLRVNTEAKGSRLIVIMSNRGLCGGYNAGLLRGALEHRQSRAAAGEKVELFVFGKKGAGYFHFLGVPMARTETLFEDTPQFTEVEPIASEMMEAYARREVDSVHVTCMKFISTSVQRVQTIQLLPIEPPASEADRLPGRRRPPVQYDFTPSADVLLAELLPEMVKVRLFQCFIDAAVSEQMARMAAMGAATEAAEDMTRALTRQYNRVRQTQITLELLDIVAGAEALR